MVEISPLEYSINEVRKSNGVWPECGYTVVQLRIGNEKGGTPYPCVIIKGRFGTWEEAQEVAKKLEAGAPVKAERILVLPTGKRTIEPPYRTTLEKVFDDYEAHTPKKGYALCAMDCFDEPGEQIYAMCSYKTYEEALAAKKKWCGNGEGTGLFILPPRRYAEPE